MVKISNFEKIQFLSGCQTDSLTDKHDAADRSVVRVLVAKAPKMFHSTTKATACFKVTAMLLLGSCFIKLTEKRKTGHMKRNTMHTVTPCLRREIPHQTTILISYPHEHKITQLTPVASSSCQVISLLQRYSGICISLRKGILLFCPDARCHSCNYQYKRKVAAIAEDSLSI
jgi:hypothetical protein